jgi:hypothetical protein
VIYSSLTLKHTSLKPPLIQHWVILTPWYYIFAWKKTSLITAMVIFLFSTQRHLSVFKFHVSSIHLTFCSKQCHLAFTENSTSNGVLCYYMILQWLLFKSTTIKIPLSYS